VQADESKNLFLQEVFKFHQFHFMILFFTVYLNLYVIWGIIRKLFGPSNATAGRDGESSNQFFRS